MTHAASEFERPSGQSVGAASDWLERLLAPGSSLGGARPKANAVDEDGTIWIAKLPSRADRHDVGAWESVLASLAARAGIAVADHRLHDLGGEYRTFTARRFDRTIDGRRVYASAMTFAGKRDGEPASYLDLALAVADHAQADAIEADLDQLFRRLVFNVLVANRDDHLRNHGFLRTVGGWRLAPAFDVNPSPGSPEHTLAIDEAVRTPDLELVAREGAVLPPLVGAGRRHRRGGPECRRGMAPGCPGDPDPSHGDRVDGGRLRSLSRATLRRGESMVRPQE